MTAPRTTSSSDVETVERVIAAPASEIFALLTDPSRHREIDGSGTVRDAKESSQVLTLGSKFGMSMKKGLSYSMVSEVVEFEPDRQIAWQTRPSIAPLGLFIDGVPGFLNCGCMTCATPAPPS